MTRMRGLQGWVILAAIVILLGAGGASGCRKKSTGTLGTAGGGVGAGDGMSARAALLQQAQSRLQTVYFEYDSSNLRQDAQTTLRTNAGVMNEYADVLFQVQGHCDERGSEEYNLALGDRRALSIKDYLVNLGVAPQRLTIITYGEERPIDPEHEEYAWSKNRRGEFVAE